MKCPFTAAAAALDGELVSTVWGWSGMPASSQLLPSLVVPPFAAGALDPAASRRDISDPHWPPYRGLSGQHGCLL